VLGPTYSEHCRAAALVGHRVAEVATIEDLAGADLAVVVNPNNPDGRLVSRQELIACAVELRSRGGILAIDEAFMDVGPPAQSLAGDADIGNIVVLRSFGKFFGLGGLRLGFAIAGPRTTARLKATLGPWAVSGAAIAIGLAGLHDASWQDASRALLDGEAQRLDRLLGERGLAVLGGTSLFRLVQTASANELFNHLGRAGILVRRFGERPTWLRFGLPPTEVAWERLHLALNGFAG
jgi:cobalamin biosynthetic protein CobC